MKKILVALLVIFTLAQHAKAASTESDAAHILLRFNVRVYPDKERPLETKTLLVRKGLTEEGIIEAIRGYIFSLNKAHINWAYQKGRPYTEGDSPIKIQDMDVIYPHYGAGP